MDDLAVKIERDILGFPSEIKKDVEEIINIVSNAETEIKKCGTDAVEKYETVGKKLVTKISQCVYNKIHNWALIRNKFIPKIHCLVFFQNYKTKSCLTEYAGEKKR